MTPDDFFDAKLTNFGDGFPPFDRPVLKRTMIEHLREGPLSDAEDIDVAAALAEMVHKEFEAYGTGGGERLSDTEARMVLRSLRASLRRLGIDFDVPWRDFTSFRSHWLREGCCGSWQARRDLLDTYFEPVHRVITELEEQAFAGELVEPITPHTGTGWSKVDQEVRELRRRFHSAATPQDYRAIGTHCVGVLEALSRIVYDPTEHLKPGESEPPVDRTKQRLGRYIETTLQGKDQENLRGLAVKTITLAHEVKHSETPTRREAGVAGDACILLANMLRRLGQPF